MSVRLTRVTLPWGTQYTYGKYRIVYRRHHRYWSVQATGFGEVFSAEYLSEVRDWLAGQPLGKED